MGLVVCKALRRLCTDNFCIIEVVFGKLVQEAPFLSFSFSFLTSQTSFEDDFSEDEWLKPLLP